MVLKIMKKKRNFECYENYENKYFVNFSEIFCFILPEEFDSQLDPESNKPRSPGNVTLPRFCLAGFCAFRFWSALFPDFFLSFCFKYGISINFYATWYGLPYYARVG